MNRIDRKFLKRYKKLNDKILSENYSKSGKFGILCDNLFSLIDSKYDLDLFSDECQVGDILFGLGECFSDEEIKREKFLYYMGYL